MEPKLSCYTANRTLTPALQKSGSEMLREKDKVNEIMRIKQEKGTQTSAPPSADLARGRHMACCVKQPNQEIRSSLSASVIRLPFDSPFVLHVRLS